MFVCCQKWLFVFFLNVLYCLLLRPSNPDHYQTHYYLKQTGHMTLYITEYIWMQKKKNSHSSKFPILLNAHRPHAFSLSLCHMDEWNTSWIRKTFQLPCRMNDGDAAQRIYRVDTGEVNSLINSVSGPVRNTLTPSVEENIRVSRRSWPFNLLHIKWHHLLIWSGQLFMLKNVAVGEKILN